MGHKVHPYVMRIGFGKDWLSKWFTANKRDYANFLEEDLRIREIIKKNYPMGSISSVVVERVSPTFVRARIRTSRPGVIIGRRGQDIERVKTQLAALTRKEVRIDVEEVSDPAKDAQLVAEQIAFQMLKRVNFRRAMKRAIQQATNVGCEGIKVSCKGRLGGVEIARQEKYKFGKIPLQTFRVDIDYGYAISRTTFGTIGVKVWVYNGLKNPGSYLISQDQQQADEAAARKR
ncbi:MAG: 30S ribosomal protein S3 [Candidatus Omnitrophica bacterium]|nr:30S ribosomal protein S3 [Candidatus Omnitrophota bacterium]